MNNLDKESEKLNNCKNNDNSGNILITSSHSSLWVVLCVVCFLAGSVISGYFAFSIALESSRTKYKELNKKIDLVTWSLQFYRKEVEKLGLELPTQAELNKRFENQDHE